jgi:hypothetical protein
MTLATGSTGFGGITASNNFGVGLPPAWDNQTAVGASCPPAGQHRLDPATSDMKFAAAPCARLLRIRQSSPLFRLTTMAEVNNQVSFFNTDNSQDALIVMALAPMGLSPTWIPTTRRSWSSSTPTRTAELHHQRRGGFTLHPVHTDGVMMIRSCNGDVQQRYRRFHHSGADNGRFRLHQPSPRPQHPVLDWVGLMWPRGGVSHAINEGATSPRLTLTFSSRSTKMASPTRGPGRWHPMFPPLG